MGSRGGLSDGTLDAFFERLADDHRQMLSSIAAQSAQALQREERRVMVMALRELEREHQELSMEVAVLTGDRLRRLVGEDDAPPLLPEVPDFPDQDVLETEVLQLMSVAKKMHVAAKQPAPPGRPRGQLAHMLRDAPRHMRSDEDMFGGVNVGEVVTDSITLHTYPSPVLQKGMTKHSLDLLPEKIATPTRSPPLLQRGMTKQSLGKSAFDTDEMMSVASARREHSVLEPISDVKRKLLRKQRLRLRTLLGLRVGEEWVGADTLQTFIARRHPSTSVDTQFCVEVISELKKVHISQTLLDQSDDTIAEDDCPGKISFKMLVELILDPDLLRFAHPDMRESIDWFCKALLAVTVEEVIDNATNVHGHGSADDANAQRRSLLRLPSRMSVLKAIIPLTVIMSITCLALSLDVFSGSRVWVVAEVIFTAIFVTEVIIKMVVLGPSGYFGGKENGWNIVDFAVTNFAIIDVSINVYSITTGSRSGAVSGWWSPLRAFRITRVFRLAKLLKTRFLKNFTNMLTGMLLGIPALSGVLFLFLVVLFILGLAFRIIWGPEIGQNYIGQCGEADIYLDMNNFANRTEYCDKYVHYMYGEEFFGTVWLSMFTTFRFMLGDYQSKNGVSLAIVFGEGYGALFHLLFGVGMIICVFGLFNIVTAIFVDSTISGLKHNDMMRKYLQQYEGRYVKSKLMALIHRVAEIMAEKNHTSRKVSTVEGTVSMNLHGRFTVVKHETLKNSARSESARLEALEQIAITFDDFCDIVEDVPVKEYLRDLDVEVYNPASFFETFDADDTGVITIMTMVQNIIRLRGEVRKNDMIASLVAVRALGKRFDQLTLAMESKNAKPNGDRNPTDSGLS